MQEVKTKNSDFSKKEKFVHLGRSKYKYVYIRKNIYNVSERKSYQVAVELSKVKEMDKRRTFCDEREAALYVDKTLIKYGYEPVNILKCKK